MVLTVRFFCLSSCHVIISTSADHRIRRPEHRIMTDSKQDHTAANAGLIYFRAPSRVQNHCEVGTLRYTYIRIQVQRL